MNEREIFNSAREFSDAAARASFLVEACGGDEAFLERVARLLKASETSDRLLDRHVVMAEESGLKFEELPVVSRSSIEKGLGSPERFRELLMASGLVTISELEQLWAVSPQTPGESLLATAEQLVRHEKLTLFQAQRLCRGQSIVLGNYLLIDQLGEGGMGLILKAEHRLMKRFVALKFVSSAVTNTGRSLVRFQREVEATSRLRHPNIVTAHDAGEADGLHFLVMEYIEGIDLSQLVKNRGVFPVDRALSCILQAAKGLEVAHDSGVIHRDIKPANLMLEEDGLLKILDLGLARIQDDIAATSESSDSGMVMGTIDYISPEQSSNSRQADARSDIYSLGMTFWYLLVGRSAYGGESMVERLLAHRDSSVPSLCSARRDVSGRVDLLFRKMVAKRPPDRFQSMAEVAVAAEAILMDEFGQRPETVFSQGADRIQPHQILQPTSIEAGTSDVHGDRTFITGGSAGVVEAPKVAVASHVGNRLTDSAVPETHGERDSQGVSGPPAWRRALVLGAGSLAAAIVFLGVIIITIKNKQGTKTEITVNEGVKIHLDLEPREPG